MNFGAEQENAGPSSPEPHPGGREIGSLSRWLWLKPLGQSPLSPVLILLAGALLIALLRIATFNEPVDRDDGFYLAFAHGMHQGKHLYRDLIDHKPPGIFVAFYLAEFLAGYGNTELFVLNVAAAIASLFAAYACCALLTGNRKAGLFAGAIWIAVSGNIPLLANQPNAEAFMNAFTLAGLACLAAAYQKKIDEASRRFFKFTRSGPYLPSHFHQSDETSFPLRPAGWGWILLAGLAFGISSLFKQVSLAVPLLVLGGTILFPLGNRPRIQACGEAALATAAIALCWLGTLLAFKLSGTYPDFVKWVFDYGKEYAGNLGANLISSVPILPIVRHSWILLPPILAGFAGIAAGFWRKNWQPALILLMLALGTHIAVALPGKTFPHYFQLWFAFASVGFGFAIHIFSRNPHWNRLALWAGCAVPLALAVLQLPDQALSPSAISVEKYGPQFREVRVLGDFLNRTLSPADTFFNFGDDAELYFYLRRAPLLPFADCVRLISPAYGARDRRALLEELQSARPEVIVADIATENYLLHPRTSGSKDLKGEQPVPGASKSVLPAASQRPPTTSRVAPPSNSAGPGQTPPYSRELIQYLEENYREQVPPIGRFKIMARKDSNWAGRHPGGKSLDQILQECLKAEEARN